MKSLLGDGNMSKAHTHRHTPRVYLSFQLIDVDEAEVP